MKPKYKSKKMIGLEAKNSSLIAVNKLLSKRVIHLQSLLTITEQKLQSIESAFDLSQKLCQHYKTENQLLRTSAPDLFSMAGAMIVATTVASDDISDNNVIDNDMNQSFGPILAICSAADSEAKDEATDDVPNSDCSTDLCKSDLIAVQYENEIKELREDWDLLSQLAVEEVVITVDDQLAANKYFPEESDEESVDECDDRMEVDFDVKSMNSISKTSETSKSEIGHKCKYCGRKYSEESALEAHKSRHKSTNSQQIRCAEELCEFQCDSKHELRDHLKSNHKNQPNSANQMRNWSTACGPNRTFVCNECKKQLSSMQSLRQHQRLIHNMTSLFKCKFSGCEQKFEKVFELRAHENEHRKQHTVIDFKQKPKTSTVSPYFEQMNGTAVSDGVPENKPHKCSYEGCSASYKHKVSLKRHEQREHMVNNILAIDNTDSNKTHQVLTAPADFKSQLQLLELFLADQQRHTEL